jgi:hypothetical protein
MPYKPLAISGHVAESVRALIEVAVDGALREIRFFMTIKPSNDADPKNFLQLSLAKLLLSAIDGASQLFVPGEMANGDRFKCFMKENFPWDRVEADRESACEFMWASARCALIHRYGVYVADTSGDLRKFGRIFPMNDEKLTAYESGTRKPNKPFFVDKEAEGAVVWIEALYCGLRQAIVKALDTPEKAGAVSTHLSSGKWDKKKGK